MSGVGEEEEEEAVVSFDGVDFSHPNGSRALFGVNLKIFRSELVAILGSNGAGKTTLVRHMNGLLKPTHGTVTVFGEKTSAMSSAQLSKRVGIVFQNPNNQLFEQTVTREIQFGLKNFGFSPDVIKNRTEWALNTFGLSEYADRAPMELSGGEKKRLCIAMVLAWEPDILILDEPTVGQDSEQKEKLTQIISLLRSQQKTVILVSHDIEFVWPLSPRVILMSNGQIFDDGPAEKVLSDRDLLAKSSVLPPQLVELARLEGWLPSSPLDALEAERWLKRETNCDKE